MLFNSYLRGGLLGLAFSAFSLAQEDTTDGLIGNPGSPGKRPSPSPTVTTCTVTAYTAVPSATANCTNILLKDITVPGNETLNLSKLKAGTTVTFAGTTSFEFANASYNMIEVGGTNITVVGAPGSVINGNGSEWWDGQGSNGGQPKPDHFFVVENLLGTANSVHDLYIENYPTHCFEVTNVQNLEMYNIVLNNAAGNAPNAKSSGLPAAHNTDGFDVSNAVNVTIHDNTVLNQDDCVAITSGNNIDVYNMYCDGSHGLSIGSVGGKSNNNVTNIYFHDSILNNVQNGARIKTNADTTGYVAGITYENIAVNNASIYGIDIQQDYLNGGPTGIPTNGVIIKDILMKNIIGDVCCGGIDVYILCGSGSCSNITLDDIVIVGGVNSTCDYEPAGNFHCPLIPVPTNTTT